MARPAAIAPEETSTTAVPLLRICCTAWTRELSASTLMPPKTVVSEEEPILMTTRFARDEVGRRMDH